MNYIGIDLGGTRIKIGLLENDNLIASQILPAKSLNGLASHLHLIDAVIEQILNDHSILSLEGIAMAFPGLVNPVKKLVLSTNGKYDDAIELNLLEYYQKKWNCPFFIDNDTRMATVAEWKLGAAKGCDDLVMVTFGTGIGTSVVIQGQLLRGKHFQAGCLGGHFTVNYDGKLCTCGNIGCIEAEASSGSLNSLADKNKHFSQSSLNGNGDIDFFRLFMEAKKGDRAAKELKDHCIKVWTAGIISYIHAYDPEQIILGGGILNSADYIIPVIKKNVEKYAWTPWGNVIIKAGQLGDFAGVIGAVYCFKNKI
ncbi:MAG: ROK family protein [Ginsengibacter sp.]